MKSKVPIVGFIIVALVITIGAILFPMALYSADYAVGNGTATNSTSMTATISGTESAWFWGVALLMMIMAISLVVWSYWK